MANFTGALLSPPDSRDYKAKDYLATGYPSIYSPPILADVEQQGEIGCCVADSLALVKTYMEYRERRTMAKYSVNYIYHNRLPNQHQGYGMYAREALSQLVKCGVPERKYLQGRSEYPNTAVKVLIDTLTDLAKPQVISSYVACSNDEELKQAISQSGAALVVVQVSREFAMNYSDLGGVGRYLTNSSIFDGVTYHAVAAIGYNGAGIEIQNSFGDTWGKGGFAVMPPNYNAIRERWAIVDKTVEWDIIELWVGEKTALVNGKERTLDVPPQIKDGRTLLPIRFVGEALGAEVEYIEQDKKIVVRRRR